MKKALILLCALALTAGAFALPVAKKAPQVNPIQNAPQEGIDAYYTWTSPTAFLALNTGGSDYQLVLFDQNDKVTIGLIFTAKSANSLAGTYILGDSEFGGGQKANSFLYGTDTKIVRYGKVTLTYRGQNPTTTADIYDIVASELLVLDEQAQQVIAYSFSGTIEGQAVWKDKYEADPTNYEARITLSETAPQASVELTVYNPQVDKSTISKGYWSIMGANYDYNNYPTAYQAEIYCAANGSDILGTYIASDFSFVDDDNNPLCGASLFTTNDDWKNYSEIEIASATGTVKKGANNTTQYEFYLTDKSNKVYHITMIEGLNTNQDIIYYDTNEDFYAQFFTEQVVPFTTDGYHKQEGNLHTTEVEAMDAVNAKYLDMVFYANRTDEAYTIPQGRYTISNIAGANTIKAGFVTVNGNDVSQGGAMAAQMISNTEIDKVRYIVSGTADVTNNEGTMYIEFNGSNSLYRTVSFTITLNLFTVGLDEVNMDEVNDGEKMMIDGQLYIKRGDNLYNAQGKIVK